MSSDWLHLDESPVCLLLARWRSCKNHLQQEWQQAPTTSCCTKLSETMNQSETSRCLCCFTTDTCIKHAFIPFTAVTAACLLSLWNMLHKWVIADGRAPKPTTPIMISVWIFVQIHKESSKLIVQTWNLARSGENVLNVAVMAAKDIYQFSSI